MLPPPAAMAEGVLLGHVGRIIGKHLDATCRSSSPKRIRLKESPLVGAAFSSAATAGGNGGLGRCRPSLPGAEPCAGAIACLLQALAEEPLPTVRLASRSHSDRALGQQQSSPTLPRRPSLQTSETSSVAAGSLMAKEVETLMNLLWRAHAAADWRSDGARALLAKHVKEWSAFQEQPMGEAPVLGEAAGDVVAIAGDVVAVAGDVVAAAGDVESAFVQDRRLAIAEVERTLVQVLERMADLRSEIEAQVTSHDADLLAYASFGVPATFDQLLKRNGSREKLDLVARCLQEALGSIDEALREPAERHADSERAVLGVLDLIVQRLTELREETVVALQAQGTRVRDECASARDAAARLWPLVERLGAFACRCAGEAAAEAQEGKYIYERQLERSLADEARYMRANAVSSSNPDFARVRADITATRELIRKLDERSGARTESISSWRNTMDKMRAWGAPIPVEWDLMVGDRDPAKRSRWRWWLW